MQPPAAVRTPAVARSIADEIATALQSEIISGLYTPGQRLVERELSRRFDVSSIPVREALFELERRGLVSRQPNKGCSVIDLSAAELDQICEMRELLEPKAAEWAACRMTDEGRDLLRAQLKRLEQPALARNFPEFFHEDLRFHKIMWELSGNRFAVSALETVVGSLFACGLRDAEGLDLEFEFNKHVRLVNALVDGRPCDASKMLEEIAVRFRKHLYVQRSGD